MKAKYIALIILMAIATAGCVQQIKKPSDSSNIKPQSPVFKSIQTDFSDDEIIKSVYSDYKVPENFYKDNLDNSDKISDSVYYEREQENNKWIFYCADNINEAKKFVEEDISEYNQRDYPDRILIETAENEKFFEFKTIENQTSHADKKYYLRYRAYKCSYIADLQHGMYYKKDGAIPDNYVGIFAQKPVTAENVKELIEFLWYSAFGNYNTVGSKVLSSFSEDNDNSIKHIIFETKIIGGDWGMCDQIILIKSTYIVNKNSGEIKLTQENIKTLNGRCN